MSPGRLGRVLLRVLATLLSLAALAVFDWYPAIKDLGRLRRERAGLSREIRDHAAMAAGIRLPGEEENSLFAAAEAEARQALPAVASDADWLAAALADLRAQNGTDGMPGSAVLFFTPAPDAAIETVRVGQRSYLDEWIHPRQADAIRAAFAVAGRFPWRGLPSAADAPERRRLAGRPLAIAVEAPLPALLNQINRVSWGRARLEIVRLVIEPGAPRGRAWLVCRGVYWVAGPTAWTIGEPEGEGGDDLLIDADSPLLLQEADPALSPAAARRELPPAQPAGSPW